MSISYPKGKNEQGVCWSPKGGKCWGKHPQKIVKSTISFQ